jgi:hypothetical protein
MFFKNNGDDLALIGWSDWYCKQVVVESDYFKKVQKNK